jgi:Icc-related predicted phosphoesterase
MRRVKSRLLYLLLLWGTVGFLASQPRVAPCNEATGGLSQLHIDDTLISVQGASIIEVNEHKLHIRALSLSPRINLNAAKDTAQNANVDESPPVAPFGLFVLNEPEKMAQPPDVDTSAPAASDLTPHVFEFSITNLDPRRVVLQGEAQLERGTQAVILRVTLAPGEAKSLQLQTTPPDAESFSFAVMGDNRGGDHTFRTILNKLNETKPLFAVNCGDLVNTGRRTEYRQFIKQLQRFQYPMFFTIGNHDVLWWGRMVYQEYFGPTYYSFDFGQAHFIFLDNALGRIDDHQFRWLEQDLQNNTKTYTFMFMHIPPFDPRPDKQHAMNSRINAQQLMNLAAKYKVSRVFCSHIHEYLREEKDGIIYLITGGAGAELRAPEAFYHYLLITVSQEGITEEVIKLH